MKVCKKCKTHVANKAKICKKCGTDVSKAPIIKSNSQKSSKKTSAPITSKKTGTIKNVKKTDNISKIDKTDKINKNIQPMEINVVEKVTKEKKNILKEEGKLVSGKLKKVKNIRDLKVLKRIKGVSFDKQKIVSILKKTLLNVKKCLMVLYAAICKVLKFIGNEIYIVLKNTGLVFWEWGVVVKSFLFAIPPKVKRFVLFIRKKSVYLYKKHKTRSTVRKNERLAKKKIKEEERIKKLKELEEEEKLKEKKISEEKIKLEKIDYIQDSEDFKQKKFYQKRVFKLLVILFVIVTLIVGSLMVFKRVYEDLTGKPVTMVSSKKARKDVVFSMNDFVSYKNVDYKIVKIETSDGNAYKQPKKGNKFLIVTVYIKNNNKKKVPYSYVNWTMSNSKNEEKNRIFTSINVDTALYSGELVVGGIKTGSMVFEQPINDPKLKMNFYELKKDEEGYDIADTSKRVFSISVKYPNTEVKEGTVEKDKHKDAKTENKKEETEKDKTEDQKNNKIVNKVKN